MTAVSRPAQLRGSHGANSVDGGPPGASGSDGGGGNSIVGGRNDGAGSVGFPFDPQRSSDAGSRLPVRRSPGLQSGG